MSREGETRFASSLFRNLVETFLNEFGVGCNEIRMVVEDPNLVDFRSSFADGFLRRRDILPILPAA